jgi:hypothetical protein
LEKLRTITPITRIETNPKIVRTQTRAEKSMKIPKNFKTTEEAFGFREAISTPLLPVEVPLDQATPLHHAYKIRILSGHPISSLREVAGLCGWLIVLWQSGSSEEKVPGRTPDGDPSGREKTLC